MKMRNVMLSLIVPAAAMGALIMYGLVAVNFVEAGRLSASTAKLGSGFVY
jgi:hypothetical protein